VRLKVDLTAGRLSLPHVGITETGAAVRLVTVIVFFPADVSII